MHPMRRFVVVLFLPVALSLVVASSLGDLVRVRDDERLLASDAGGIVFVRPASIDSVVDLPARGALVVVRDDAGAASFGRVMGLPGESLRLAAGELRQGDEPLVLPFDQQAWIPWSDTARESSAAAWAGLEAWTRDATGWSGDFRSPALRLGRLDDGWLRDDGTRAPGVACDPALRVVLRVLWNRPQAQLLVELRADDAVAQLVVEREGGKISNALRLLDGEGGAVRRGLAYTDLRDLPEGAFEQEWSFEARTGWLQVRVDGEHYMSAPLPRLDGASRHARGAPRALVRLGAGGATLARIATWRAPVWRDDAPALQVAAGHCLVLPDAPVAGSRWAACHRPWGAILGRPVAVVWPPSAWRRLP
jgi:hypothetical protein